MSEVNKTKCPNCDRGRVNSGGGWTKCEMCGGSAEVEGVAAARVPTVETVMSGGGYTREQAQAIVALEQRKADRGEKPYGTNDPLPMVWNASANATFLPLKKSDILPGITLVKMRQGDGTIMTVTADMKDGEVACEWKVVDDKGNAGKNSGVFRIASLDAIPPPDGPGGTPGS